MVINPELVSFIESNYPKEKVANALLVSFCLESGIPSLRDTVFNLDDEEYQDYVNQLTILKEGKLVPKYSMFQRMDIAKMRYFYNLLKHKGVENKGYLNNPLPYSIFNDAEIQEVLTEMLEMNPDLDMNDLTDKITEYYKEGDKLTTVSRFLRNNKINLL